MDLFSLMGAAPPEQDRPGSLLMSLIESQNMAQPQARGPSPNALQGGGLFELIYGGNKFNPSSADASHQSHLHVAGNKMGKLGRYLQSLGFNVGENPKFGGVAPVHTDNSYHYKGKALDVNYGGGGRWDSEAQALSWLEKYLSNNWR